MAGGGSSASGRDDRAKNGENVTNTDLTAKTFDEKTDMAGDEEHESDEGFASLSDGANDDGVSAATESEDDAESEAHGRKTWSEVKPSSSFLSRLPVRESPSVTSEDGFAKVSPPSASRGISSDDEGLPRPARARKPQLKSIKNTPVSAATKAAIKRAKHRRSHSHDGASIVMPAPAAQVISAVDDLDSPPRSDDSNLTDTDNEEHVGDSGAESDNAGAETDLTERPDCAECEDSSADIECNMCMEFYCATCFATLHKKGRRRLHTFRRLRLRETGGEGAGNAADDADTGEKEVPDSQKSARGAPGAAPVGKAQTENAGASIDSQLAEFSEESSTVPRVCRDHLEVNTFFCYTCNRLVCPSCLLIGKHKHHKYQPMHDSYRDLKKRMRKRLTLMEGEKSRFNKIVMQYEEVLLRVSNEASSLRDHVHSRCDEMREILEKKEAELIASAEKLEKSRIAEVDRSLSILHSRLEQTNTVLSRITDALDIRDDTTFIWEYCRPDTGVRATMQSIRETWHEQGDPQIDTDLHIVENLGSSLDTSAVSDALQSLTMKSVAKERRSSIGPSRPSAVKRQRSKLPAPARRSLDKS